MIRHPIYEGHNGDCPEYKTLSEGKILDDNPYPSFVIAEANGTNVGIINWKDKKTKQVFSVEIRPNLENKYVFYAPDEVEMPADYEEVNGTRCIYVASVKDPKTFKIVKSRHLVIEQRTGDVALIEFDGDEIYEG